MGLDPDTPPEDLMLVEPLIDEAGRHLGAQPAGAVIREFHRCSRWLKSEQSKADAEHG